MNMNLNDKKEEKKTEPVIKKEPEKKEVPPVLEVNVFDKVAGKAVGPGQL